MSSIMLIKPFVWVLMSAACGMAVVRPASAAETVRVALPGEADTKPAMSPAPFPDRISAFVWRNWGLAEVGRLAEVVKATPDQLNDIAAEMGLRRNPAVLPEWRTKGYITVLRRNWHLLPYDQLTALLGKTREELAFCLMEDDFLWVKLGKLKPLCRPLLYAADEVRASAPARREIAAVLAREGIDPNAAEEPRFSFVGRIAAADPRFRPPEATASPFGFRMIFSYFADYGDPLGDPEIGSYPDGLLQKLCAQGVNAVWLHTVLRTLAKDPKYPEFGDGSERRIANLRKLVARCGRYGIKVYLYMNEPRAMPDAFFRGQPAREAFRGCRDHALDNYAMCTSCGEPRRWLRDSLEQVFRQVPGLGGIFTITMSENLTNCASHGRKGDCPRCRGRSVADIVAEVNRTMVEGMCAGNPQAEALIWNWGWPIEEEAKIVAALPRRNCRLMAVSEKGMEVVRGGVMATERDYSLSIVGPGEAARRFWGLARKAGIPAVAKVQAGNSWELSPFPYLPVMDLVAEHACNLANAGVDGVMLSWSLGCYPSPNLSVYRELGTGETSPEAVLNRLAADLYGKDRAAAARAAWKAFSDGFRNYPFDINVLYNGPQQWGPANPLYWRPTGWKATMVGIPYDDLDGWRSIYPPETFAALFDRVAAGFDEGCRRMEGVASPKELSLFRAEAMHFASAADQARFVLARARGDRTEQERIAARELVRAKAYLPLVRADSRIGYESSNHYFFLPQDVIEKALSCEVVAKPSSDREARTPPQRRCGVSPHQNGGSATASCVLRR